MSRGIFSYVDWHLLTPVIILAILSLSTLFSINTDLFRSQLFFFILSFVVCIFFSFVQLDNFKKHTLLIYIVSVVLLLFLLLIGIETRGAARWIDIFGIRIQFSEILKPFLAVAFSYFLAKRGYSLKSFLIYIALVGFIAFLIQKQPDLGNAITYIVASLFTMLYFGFPFLWFAALGIGTAILTPLLWHFLHDYQKSRVLTFIHPTSDPQGSSYNAIQALIAVGSGMFFGKGLGQGTQSGLRFLPERHTDFIFATLSEDFGFFGSLVLFACFAYLLYRIYIILENTNNRFQKIFCAAAFFLFLTQLFFNIGMNMGLLPIVGITLPFVSYGGSSLLSNFIFLGMLSSISKSFRNRNTLEIR